MKIVSVFLVYADWCPHCTKFKPEWEHFCDINKNNADVDMHKISDMEMEEKINMINNTLLKGSSEKIDMTNRGFPTILKIEGGKVEFFENERSLSNLANWIGKDMKGGKGKSTYRGGSHKRKQRKNTNKNRNKKTRKTLSKK